jgi:hypothetical protein
MKYLKTFAKFSKEIPDDFRVQFRLLAANCTEKYDLGKYNPEIIGEELKDKPYTIIWGEKKYDKDGAYAQLFCIDKREIPDNCISRFREIEETWINSI